LLHPIKKSDLKPTIETEVEIKDGDLIESDKSDDLESAKETFELNFRDNQVLASLKDGTRGVWKTAQVMYSYPLPHKVIFLIESHEWDQPKIPQNSHFE
jgi:hypothetical protein